MDQIETTQFKKLSRGEYSQARRSTGETTNFSSDHGQKFDVFLSHSGKQKNFVRQLHRDLTNQGVSCFFDQDRESLPVGEDFPSRIFKAALTCTVAVLLLSTDFLESKWPMQELYAFVGARDITRTNPNLKILPLFFGISPDDLKNTEEINKKWEQLNISREKRDEWHQALKTIRGINGLSFNERDDEVQFREEIAKAIWHILPTPSPRYHLPGMQGEVRMCQEVAGFFKSVRSDRKGICIAGLYGIPGQGKTTLGKAFCNFKLGDFEGKVCHLEFSRGDSFQRVKNALQHLTHCPLSFLHTLVDRDQAQVELHRRVKGQRVLLVLDNITGESVDEVMYYLKADLGEMSCILLSSRSLDVLEKHFKIGKQLCMRVPRLEEDEAIAILLERASIEEPTLGAEDKAFAVKCADRCSFKEIGRRGRTFHPLALKVFGRYLFRKYGCHLSKWVAEIEGWVDQCGSGLDDLLALLGKAFDDMRPEYHTIFMLLTVYMLSNISPHKVTEWLAMVLNEEISVIEKAVEDLCMKAFIEESGPEICIHDLYIEFAQSKANEMGRWLWWKGDPRSTRGLISKHDAGFELAKLEQCRYRKPSQITPHDRENLLVLQLVDVENMSKLDLGGMGRLRSITLHKCKDLAALQGIEKLQQLAWLQISEVNAMFKLPELSSLQGLQHLEINLAVSKVVNQLGDLTGCVFLREINVRCPSLLEFPRLNGLPYLEKVEFSVCDKVKGPLDCAECMELQSIVIDSCSQMAASPLLVGCMNVSKIVLWECDAVKACPDIDVPSALKTLELFVSSKAASAPILESCNGLEILQLWNMEELKELPSFKVLTNLTVLKLGKCGIREPPDLTCCVMLEDVYFFRLKNLVRFPKFSLLRKLKKLSLCECTRVQDPPEINDYDELEVFHLVYNDNMQGLPKMDGCPLLEEFKLSWRSEDEVTCEATDPDSLEDDDDNESQLGHFKYEELLKLSDVSIPETLKKWEWLKGKTMLVKQYFRGGKLYYSVAARTKETCVLSET